MKWISTWRLMSRQQSAFEVANRLIGTSAITIALSVALSQVSGAQTTISGVAMVNNATQTPVEGVGHDYLHDLSETVNPQNGQVSIRIAGPDAHERGLNSPHFAFMYDT